MKSHIENIKEIKNGCYRMLGVILRCRESYLCPSCRSKLDGYLMALDIDLKLDKEINEYMHEDTKNALKDYYKKIKDCEQAIEEGEKLI